VSTTIPDRRFDPTGSYGTRWTAAGVDIRIPATPFLGTTQPMALQNAAAGTGSPDLTKDRDWLHITNVSPDGRFANLYNLAPCDPGTGERFSSFRARSAFPVSAL